MERYSVVLYAEGAAIVDIGTHPPRTVVDIVIPSLQTKVGVGEGQDDHKGEIYMKLCDDDATPRTLRRSEPSSCMRRQTAPR